MAQNMVTSVADGNKGGKVVEIVLHDRVCLFKLQKTYFTYVVQLNYFKRYHLFLMKPRIPKRSFVRCPWVLAATGHYILFPGKNTLSVLASICNSTY